MLIDDFQAIGSKLYTFRKRSGLRQIDVAVAAGISERNYADIERGLVNTRLSTLLRICDVLGITPDAILTEDSTSLAVREEEILLRLHHCSPEKKETALRLLEVYLDSLPTSSFEQDSQ